MRLKLKTFAVLLLLIAIAPAALGNDYGAVRGVVHDPQHRPIQNAMVMLRAKSSEWSKSVTTAANGEFQFNAVALGEYSVSVASEGFAQTAQDVVVISGSVPVVHFQLQVAGAEETDSRFRYARHRRHRRLHADHPHQPPRHRAHSRRRPLQQISMITDYVPGA